MSTSLAATGAPAEGCIVMTLASSDHLESVRDWRRGRRPSRCGWRGAWRRRAGASSAVGVSTRPLSFAEHVCLVLISQKVSHGWALGSLLAPEGELGRI